MADDVALVATLDSAWSALSRSYWDTSFVSGRWRTLYDSLRPAVRDANTAASLREALAVLIAAPRVSHMALVPREALPADEAGRPGGAADGSAGLDVRFIGDSLVVWRVHPGGAAARARILPGAIVTRIGATEVASVQGRLQRALGGDSALARSLLLTVIAGRMQGPVGDTLRLQFLDDSRSPTNVSLVWEQQAGELARLGNLPPMMVTAATRWVPLDATAPEGPSAALVSFTAWFAPVVPPVDDALFGARDAAGIIVDLRGNPGGVVGMLSGVAGHFLDSARALGTLRSRHATIRLAANPRLVNRRGERVQPYAGPVAILVDKLTASTSEFFTAGLQALARARVFGAPSAGQALPAVMRRLPNGDLLMHPIADHLDAGGRRVEGVGVTPDEVVPLTRADIVAGRDAALEAALGWIASEGQRGSSARH